MFPFPHYNDFLNDSHSEASSDARPPQYNDTNCGCGYRCGWGCEEPASEEDDGVVSDSDATVVNPDDSDEEIDHEDLDQDLGTNLERDDISIADEVDGERNGIIFLSNDWDDFPVYALFPHDGDVLSESMDVNCVTRSPSITPSSDGSNGARSPNPEFELDTAGMPVVQLAGFYYFSESPLRLNP